MKKLLLLFTLATYALFAYAQPKLVGHRGSGYGLENSEESFKKGIELGYHYLETDIKTTKDNRFVCTHDDDTKRLGGTKTIATSTLEELQSETLSQTRNGVKYTGHICSLDEYLQICKDGGVGAVIELKWATGINNNDQSKIPLVIKLIDEMEMRKNVIILTSMKPCLEYIRTNYPDITLQFLTGEYWESHFDWCVKWKIDVDIQSGYFDKSTVRKYHNEGLKVNMWTTNDEAGYRTYGNMGCDFITTDRLDGHNLPDLDPDLNFQPNFMDYPEVTDVTIKGNYTISDAATNALPAELSGKTLRKAAKMNGGWALLYVNSENTPELYFFDGKTAVPMSLEGVSDGLAPLYNIATTSDGKLFGCNLANVKSDEATSGFLRTYLWENAKDAPKTLWATNQFAQAGNWVSGIVGEFMTVSGKDLNLKAFISSRSASGSTYRLCGYESENAELLNAVYAMNNNAYTKDIWGNYQITVTPASRDNIIISSSIFSPNEYRFQFSGTRIPMEDYATVPVASRGLTFFRYGEKIYAVLPEVATDGKVTFTVYDITTGYDGMYAVTEETEVGTMPDAEGFITSKATKNSDGSITIEIFAEGIGVYSAIFNKPEETAEPVDLGLVLERKWILSNSTNNHPGNIDGTNAQQGTAVKGVFYINNCVEKLIHVFDKTGHLGTIPGGAGWGCAKDDAGNIIVRDDKLTGTSHSFIIYPAGAMPDNYGTPVRLDVTVPLEGQTNFINASGDLLGDGGYIYLYPNKQAKINIINIAGGEVVSVRESQKISISGTTAGYVIPINNNFENWLYQIRANGINEYNGGTIINCLTSRTSTTAPARNSTGGGAYLIEGGNKILVHNSGANYKGGFTVRDLTMDKVIKSVDPIGTLGYETGGNYSTFNWLFLERLGYADYVLYQYCPANGIAMYTLRNPSLGVEGIGDDASDTRLTFEVTPTEIVANASGLRLYDLAGKLIRSSKGNRISIVSLDKGIYILRANNGKSSKVSL